MPPKKIDPQKQQEKERREAQLKDIASVINDFTSQLKTLQAGGKQLDLLVSVSSGLYSEIDKLSKKAPSEKVTVLVLEQLNDVIKESKELVSDDPYMQRLNMFVAAGDNPEHRDAVVVLTSVRQGLERYRSHSNSLQQYTITKLAEAKLIKRSLELYLSGNEEVESSAFDRGEIKHVTWDTWSFKAAYGGETYFSFSRLDRLDFTSYFSPEGE